MEESDVTLRCASEQIRLVVDVNAFVSLSHSLNNDVAHYPGTFFDMCVLRSVIHSYQAVGRGPLPVLSLFSPL
jgi:hypothetical protein